MFSNSHNLLLSGGIYTDNRVEKHFHGIQRRGIDLLLEASSPGAFHNSGGRFDPPKCHPNTRTAVLSTIMKWVIEKVVWDGLILWLYGPAGAGKSAILQTLAEKCHIQRILLASYFFSRTDSKRNNEKYLVASLAYQIAVNLPPIRDLVDAAIDNNPAIFQLSINIQLSALIVEPLIQLSQTGIFQSTLVPYLIIIDGLDECLGAHVQRHLIHAIATAVSQHTLPVMFLISSRPEQQIFLEFSISPSQGLTKRVPLDNTYRPDEDIARYLKDSFWKIKTTHPFIMDIPPIWPTNEMFRILVRKSSGQFVYAATVVKYISSPRHLPTKRLEVIMGLRPAQNDMPFAELDALYIGILSSVEDLATTLLVLNVLILGDLEENTPEDLEEFMFLDPGDIRRLLIDLTSVIECAPGKYSPIKMLHASFPDFLLDPARSKEYHIKPSSAHTELARLCIKHINQHHSCEICLENYNTMGTITRYSFHTLVGHFLRAEPTVILREEILNTYYIPSLFKFSRQDNPDSEFQRGVTGFLSFLKTSKFSNTNELYFHHRNIWDMMTRQKLADFPSCPGLDIGLVFICLGLSVDGAANPFPSLDNFHFEGADSWGGTEFSRPGLSNVLLWPGYTNEFRSTPLDSGYRTLLQEFLIDPSRGGEYFIDGNMYSVVAQLLLDGFIRPYASQEFLDDFPDSEIPELLDAVTILLSRSGPSKDLIALINHTNIVFHKRCRRYEDKVQPIIEEIHNYLLKFHGSVPSGLRFSLDEKEDDWQD